MSEIGNSANSGRRSKLKSSGNATGGKNRVETQRNSVMLSERSRRLFLGAGRKCWQTAANADLTSGLYVRKSSVKSLK